MSGTRQKSVLITGCSADGIGEELARQFHSRGHRVFATARTASSMEVLQKLGIETLIIDVTDVKTIEAAKEAIRELTGGKLDILINNAGTSYPHSIFDSSIEAIKAVYDVNVFGQMVMIQKFIDMLIASGNGRIVQIGSISGCIPMPFSCAYSTSKAALHCFGDGLRVELAPFNVDVITVAAGNIKTNITKPWHKLPPNSLFQPISDIYRDRRILHFQDKAMPRDVAVKPIVDESLKSKPRPWIWVGTNSWLGWFITTFMSRTAADKNMSDRFGLTKLSELLHKKAD